MSMKSLFKGGIAAVAILSAFAANADEEADLDHQRRDRNHGSYRCASAC